MNNEPDPKVPQQTPEITPEELAILKHRLATIDNAVSGEELLARVKEHFKKRAEER